MRASLAGPPAPTPPGALVQRGHLVWTSEVGLDCSVEQNLELLLSRLTLQIKIFPFTP